MRIRVRLLVLAALVGSGCNDPSSGPLDIPEFRVSPGVTWSGGTATITSTYFVDRAIPVITVDTVTLVVTRLDDSTVSTVLPSFPSGTYPVLLNDPDLPGPIGFVELVGFNARQDVSPGINGMLVAARAPQGPVVLGNVPAGHVGMLNPVTGIFTEFPGLWAPSVTSGYNVAPSYQGADVFTLRDTSGVVGEWRLWPAPVMLDTVGSGFKGQFTRHIVPFRSDIYLQTGSHTSTTFSPGGNRMFTTESVWANFISVAADRAVAGSNVGQPGIQVFDMASGDTAFTLPIRSSFGAAFSADGSLLFASGGEPPDLKHLLRVDAAAGNVLARDSAPAGVLKYSVALSSSGNRLYVAGEANGRPRVLVYDAVTLALVASLSVPDGESFDCALTCWEGAISLDEPFGKLYYTVPSDLPDVPTRVYGFDVLPE
jgi:hypothetical protein